MLNEHDLKLIAARSLTLYERVSANPLLSDHNDQLINHRLQAWRHAVAAGDERDFQRRLHQDGLSEQQVRPVLANIDLKAHAELPPWCDFLQHSLSACHAWTDVKIFRSPPDDSVYPFYSLALPFIDRAELALREKTAAGSNAILDALLSQALPKLANLLCHQASLTHQLEFNIYLNRHESALARVMRQAMEQASDQYYREFIRSYYAGKWPLFLCEYPVLARQLAQLSLNWVDACNELIQRYTSDREQLALQFDITIDDTISGIEWGCSDRHNRGRTTAILSFVSGQRLVYKPKPLATDHFMADIIQWLNNHSRDMDGDFLSLHCVNTLDRGGYGWQQWISRQPCENKRDIESYYIRMGQLLALVYALEGYDYHHENIIASGAIPYLVDTETIFNPYKEMALISSAEADAATLASQQVFYSVIRTGMLPLWSIRNNGGRQDTSGLGGGSVTQNDDIKRYRWHAINSDDMRLESYTEALKPQQNLPVLRNGETIGAEEYITAIRAGFRNGYQLILQSKESFIDVLKLWRATPVRFVRKATRIYSEQLWRLTSPKNLRDGIDWSIALEYQGRMFLAANAANHDIWRLLHEEYANLMQADIPYFKVHADSLHIFNGNGDVVVRDYFHRNCIDRLTEKAALMNARDLELQDRYIAYSFYARHATSIHDDASLANISGDLNKESTDSLPPVDQIRCRQVADTIAQELLAEALKADDGSISWIALEYLKEADVFQFKPISYNLYSGGMGVALFLAAMAKITEQQPYRQATHAALKPLLRIIEQEAGKVIRFSGLGIGVGLGSLVYGLTTIAELLEEDYSESNYLTLAIQCCHSIDDEMLALDQKYDLIFGAAGAALALSKLFKLTASPLVLDKLTLLGEHLIKAAENKTGLVPTYRGDAVTGLSHGAAGIALALARIFEATGQNHYLMAAQHHLNFEESLYDPTENNYQDYRSRENQPAFMTTWCHGAPGIGLSRIKIHAITGDTALLPVVDKTMKKTAGFTLNHLDHLCCGAVGRLDILWEAACYRDQKALQAEVRRDASYILNEFERRDGFRLNFLATNKVFSPGLFVGASGIAYGLLRIAYPGQLPCILAFD